MHEQSETVQDPKTGKWYNVYGRRTATPGKRFKSGAGSRDYDTVDQAVEAAKNRSALGHAAEFLEEGSNAKSDK